MSEQPSSRALRARFITVCQQVLALAAVLAVLTPAARTVTMDVRPMPLGGHASAAAVSGGGTAGLAAYVRSSTAAIAVPTAPVTPTVKSYQLTAPRGARLAPGAIRVTTRRTTQGSQITTRSLPVKGYGGVGVTWAHANAAVPQSAITLDARTLKAGRWSAWSTIGYDADQGPDAGTAEARHERPGTDLLMVGHVQRVQVRVDSRQAAPADMQVAVVDPGTPKATRMERPALNTADLAASPSGGRLMRTTTTTATETPGYTAPPKVTPEPKIYTRAQWGANEAWRDKPSLHYGDVQAGFIHHTVQANNYTRAEVPAMIRADYYYHTHTRGWSDIGYNYLIDRFGRIWEGRYGGITRDPVGAHTLGYNSDSFAASAIGNYQITRPSAAMVKAYASLFAWKLSLAGISATATHQYVTSRYFNAINGHRDAGQTLCPGQYLYAKIPQIRQMAKADQASWAGRNLQSNLVGSAGPDIVVRRTTDGEGFILPINVSSAGVPTLGKAVDTGIDLSGATTVLRVGDWDRDGYGDLVVRRKADPQDLYLYRGMGNGHFAAPILISSAMKGIQMLTAVGDFTGDGYPDLMGETSTGAMEIFPGRGTNGVGAGYAAYPHIPVRKMLGVGRWNADGAPDVIVRTTSSALTAYYGNGPGGLVGHQALSLDTSPYNQMVAVASANSDGHTDLVARDASGRLYVLPGTTSAKFKPRIKLGYAKGYNLFG
ncbi:MAG: FG-GAP-like repeat-containing protein [Nocardioidaceae bacterium]|nr:FG-GAP-like repeat-containing protein [Nocardioidaceae bacterium]MCL2613060.1 FG-GAP-like repeat-containing protein [Nocardioidaceae bacterium]